MKKQIKAPENETTMTVSKETRRKLNMWKYALDCKNIDELLEKIFKIIPASELEIYKK